MLLDYNATFSFIHQHYAWNETVLFANSTKRNGKLFLPGESQSLNILPSFVSWRSPLARFYVTTVLKSCLHPSPIPIPFSLSKTSKCPVLLWCYLLRFCFRQTRKEQFVFWQDISVIQRKKYPSTLLGYSVWSRNQTNVR